MKSEAEKRASQKWDKEHLHTASARLSMGDYERFKAACERRNETMHAAIMRYCKYYAKKYGSAAAPPRALRAGSARLRPRGSAAPTVAALPATVAPLRQCGSAAPASAARPAYARRRRPSNRTQKRGWKQL